MRSDSKVTVRQREWEKEQERAKLREEEEKEEYYNGKRRSEKVVRIQAAIWSFSALQKKKEEEGKSKARGKFY